MSDPTVMPLGQETQTQPADFELATALARIAAEEYATGKENYGTNAVLPRFNAQVSFWANRFTNVRYRRFMYTMGSLMGGASHSYTPSVALIIKRYRERHPGKTISPKTVKTYTDAMAAYGIMDVTRRHQGSEDEHPGAQKANEYRVHFDRVLVDGQAVPHDFTRVSPSWSADGPATEPDISNRSDKSEIGSAVGSAVGSAPGSAPGGAPLTYSSTPPDSSKTSGGVTTSSRPGDDVDAPAASNRAKGSARPSSSPGTGGSTRASKASSASSSVPAGKVPGGSGVPAVPPVEEYIADLEGCVEELARRLGMEPGQINIRVLARMWRETMARCGENAGVSNLLKAWPADWQIWEILSDKHTPVGYFLDEVERWLVEVDQDEVPA